MSRSPVRAMIAGLSRIENGAEWERAVEAILSCIADDLGLPEPESDSFELELDGATYTLPIALKGAFLRQADYTRKTQELAIERQRLERVGLLLGRAC